MHRFQIAYILYQFIRLGVNCVTTFCFDHDAFITQ